MNFFTKHRILIILLGLDFGLLFILLANGVANGSITRDLLVNLSAGSIAISITVVLVDYLVNSEYRLKNKEATDIAANDLLTAALLLLMPLFHLYKQDNGLINGKTVKEAPVEIVKALDALDMKSAPQIKKDLTRDYVFAIRSAKPILQDIQANYGYALPGELKGVILKLAKNSTTLIHLATSPDEQALTHASTADIIRPFYIGLFGDIKKLVHYSSQL